MVMVAIECLLSYLGIALLYNKKDHIMTRTCYSHIVQMNALGVRWNTETNNRASHQPNHPLMLMLSYFVQVNSLRV